MEAHDKRLLLTRLPRPTEKIHAFLLELVWLHHVLRSRLKSFLTLAVALGFMLASGWIRQTMERSRTEVDRLYDTTVVAADIVLADPTNYQPKTHPPKEVALSTSRPSTAS